jgi:hypothetical protein
MLFITIFASVYDVKGDDAPDNMLAFIDPVQGQPGYRNK